MIRLFYLVVALISFNSFASNSTGWSDYADIVASASVKTNVDVITLAVLGDLESSYNPKAKAKTSSAKGLYQFTKRTWRVTVNSYGSKHDITNPDIYNPVHNTLMAAEYIQENYNILKRRLRREPKLHEVYLSHVISPVKTTVLLRSRGRIPAAWILPKEARANRTLFYHRNGKAKSITEFVRYIRYKVNKSKRKYAILAKEALRLELLRIERGEKLMYAKYLSEKWKCSKYNLLRKYGNDIYTTSPSEYINITYNTTPLNHIHSNYTVDTKFTDKRFSVSRWKLTYEAA